MKPMIWHPEPNDEKVNQYLDSSNKEPWLAFLAIGVIIVCVSTLLILLGTV
ncbi:hypothetical protein [Hydrocoleum sp. CS-953]|uniref:hypothetical protein n=1 Tax=Microcoleaceae TaxID=1892252 RepID=UPI00143D4F63|nr:hypothetical protein [Hydrocoleum sp. CS-953]